MSAGISLQLSWLLLLVLQCSRIQGACNFDTKWYGRWFQNGVPNPILINSTHIETKGECYEQQDDKFLVYDRTENCYRCMVMYGKHEAVLQYKESIAYCALKSTLADVCSMINSDDTQYSMFRKYPEIQPVACPFKNAPFTLSYNRGTGDCAIPPSRADSCTDDSRLVLKYQACADVASSESNVEELVCLATWKEGSTRYLVGRIYQGNRRTLTSDEDQYRCFIYQRSSERGKTVYYIAQSADATCNGIQSAREGSKTMVLTALDDKHQKCRFLDWITDHHTWVSLDKKRTYRFSHHNATLRILDEDTPKLLKPKIPQHPAVYGFEERGFESEDQKKHSEMRVMCHAILQRLPDQVQIVAQVTAGCDSGYICMIFYRRDTNIIEIQQSEDMVDNADDACSNFRPSTAPFITLLTPNLHPKKCPHLGKYTVTHNVNNINNNNENSRRKRNQPNIDKLNKNEECLARDFEALAVGCSGSHEMEFKRSCPEPTHSTYSCHGGWTEDGTTYVVTSMERGTQGETQRYCFSYTPKIIPGEMITSTNPPMLSLVRGSDTCRRPVHIGTDPSNWAYNFTSNGTCADSDGTNDSTKLLVPGLLLVLLVPFGALVLR